MDNIKEYCDYLTSFKRTNDVSIDTCHNLLIFGLLVSHKPERVLELGIGNGYVTNAIMSAIKYNGVGSLDTVDSFHDWNMSTKEDLAKILKEIDKIGTHIYAPVLEQVFVKQVPDNTYDFIISDADHHHVGEWTDEIWRIGKPNAVIIVHDIYSYRSPFNYVVEAGKLKKPVFIFNKSSRPDEQCENGMAVILNGK